MGLNNNQYDGLGGLGFRGLNNYQDYGPRFFCMSIVWGARGYRPSSKHGNPAEALQRLLSFEKGFYRIPFF